MILSSLSRRPINSKFSRLLRATSALFSFLNYCKNVYYRSGIALTQYNTQLERFREKSEVYVYVTVIMRITLRRNGALISHRRSKKMTTRISGSREACLRYVNACNSLSSEGLLSRRHKTESIIDIKRKKNVIAIYCLQKSLQLHSQENSRQSSLLNYNL